MELPDGRTPLHMASEKGFTKMAVELIKRGANSFKTDNAGKLPICSIIQSEEVRVLPKIWSSLSSWILFFESHKEVSRYYYSLLVYQWWVTYVCRPYLFIGLWSNSPTIFLESEYFHWLLLRVTPGFRISSWTRSACSLKADSLLPLDSKRLIAVCNTAERTTLDSRCWRTMKYVVLTTKILPVSTWNL